jgi:hypothetical protein
MNEKREAIYEKLDTQLTAWSAQMDRFKAMGASAEAKFTSECGTTLEALQHKHAEASAKLAELKAAGDEAWDRLEAGLEKILADGTAAYHAAEAKFK